MFFFSIWGIQDKIMLSEAVRQPAWSELSWKDKFGAMWCYKVCCTTSHWGRSKSGSEAELTVAGTVSHLLQDEDPTGMKERKGHEDLSLPFLIYSEASSKDSQRARD